MSFWDRITKKNVRLENVEPNHIYEVGEDDVGDVHYHGSQNWVDLAPPKIKPTIKNRRKASRFPTVYGIISNLILKTISSFTIDGDNQEAVDFIVERDKEWNLKNLAYECLWKNFVDGECFYEYVIEDNMLSLRGLAFDGDRFRIKKLYDEHAKLMGYMQWVLRDGKINNNWKNQKFYNLFQTKEQVTLTFMPEEISNPIFIEIDGVGESLVKNVIDLAYEVEALNRMMPSITHKSANIMVATIGNENRKETKIDDRARDRIADNIADFHKKGVITLPYGVSLEVVGDNVLPKIQDYISVLKSQIYEGLVTPESLYSSESSNRSTAEVQLTDSRTGHVLFIEYAQEFLKRWIERDIINKQLELAGFPEDCVWIDFMTGDKDLDNNYLLKDDNESLDEEESIEKKESEDDDEEDSEIEEEDKE